MKRLRYLTLALASLPVMVCAQNEDDALRYSELGQGGTARFIAMSGAFGALGGDLSTLHYNPAGLGVFRTSQLTFAPTYIQTNSSNTFNDDITRESRIGMKINNLGLSVAIPTDDDDWKFVNIGFSYSLQTDFNSDVRIRTNNYTESLGNAFADEAFGTYANNLYGDAPFSSGLAYSTYLIDPVNEDSTEFQSKTFGQEIDMNRRIKERGHLGETAFSIGSNYKDVLYLGATIGVPRVRYGSTMTHTEDVNDENSDLNEFTYRNELSVTGSGINFKLGAIVKVTNWLRLGAAWHSPTNLTLRDEYSAELKTRHNISPDGDNFTFQDESGASEYDYRIITPARFLISGALVAGNRGAINVDYEVVNYQNAKLKPSYAIESDGYEFDIENNAIANNFIRGNRLKIGGEYRIDEWTIRGGISQSSAPFNKNVVDTHLETTGFSFGAGYQTKVWFLDFAYNQLQSTRDYYPFAAADNAVLKRTFSQVAFTFGLKF